MRTLQLLTIALASLISLGAVSVCKADLIFTSIVFPGAGDTYAQGINNKGEILGQYIDRDGYRHGFLDNKGVFTSFDVGTPENLFRDQLYHTCLSWFLPI
jgi:hypothetical protein